MCADIVTPEQRSAMMSRIRGKNTRPELALRRQLFAAGYRFRLHRRDLPGTPDVVLPRYQVALFMHGCFWHRHTGCPMTTVPSTNAAFWEAKFSANVERDAAAVRRLQELGWRVAVVWECVIGPDGLTALQFDRLVAWISQATGASAGTRRRDLLELP
ncbi:very short patch repair endonuclease [Variovorax robiniae]|uniref:Very short patch repair endonuclease n=1 Tax=Variovorax robiniae TaxID=1836199 RepID=A0ABU8XG05_9BURK